tara:strand:- start:703 stop:1281 length:579 start_codon:yes stop_codon:yes gene_type:complete
MNEVILIGGGGHCKSVIDVIEHEGSFKIAGIIDKANLLGTDVLGYKVIGTDNDLPDLVKNCKHAFITVGHIKSPSLRQKLYKLAITAGFVLPSIVSPNAYVSKHASIGKGTIIMNHAVINSSASVGDNCIINSKSLIEHDCSISNHCHISTGAIINGGSIIGSGCFIGSNATTKELVKVPKNSFIKAGCLVT